MEQSHPMTLQQAVNIAAEVTPAPAQAHQALAKLCDALAHSLCIPRPSLRAYAAELDAAPIENMPPENELVIHRPVDDKNTQLESMPAGLTALQLGLLDYLVSLYERTTISIKWIADHLCSGDVEMVRSGMIGLQASSYLFYDEDANTLLVRSRR